jgi:hypothetical protein
MFHGFVCSEYLKDPQVRRQMHLSFGVKEALTYFMQGAARKGKGKFVGSME